jgi:hypothetical protein
MNILFAMERRVDAGSIHALVNYARAGRKLGHRIALYGNPDPDFPEVPFSTDLAGIDFVVFVFESRLGWISGLHLTRLLTAIPRSRRVVFDADGMYNPLLLHEDYDRNHGSERERQGWLAAYESLADRIFQPTLRPQRRGVSPLPFYGYDARAVAAEGLAKRVDIMYLGHNWWRWREVSERLLPALEQVRDRFGDICFVGLWWDAPPAWAAQIGQQDAFCVDPDRLRALRVRTVPAVPYRDVVATMSTARINIMTQRPLFRRLRLLTSKYFEVFQADTIPLVMLDPEHAAEVYGPAGRELALHNDIADKLADVLARPAAYRTCVTAVRRHLATHHSYERRVQDLVAALTGDVLAAPAG